MLRRMTLMAAVIGAVVTLVAGSAAASAGPTFNSPEQAGYAATGAHFKEVDVWAKLPDAARFAREIGRLSLSVQLWDSTSVVDLSASACTDATCKPGGRPVTRDYSLGFTVFSRTTGALICATSNRTCPNIPPAWNRARFAPGRTLAFSLFYDPRAGFMEGQVNNQTYWGYTPGAGVVYTQARIGAEFGATPWSTTPFRAPRTRTLVASFGVPPAPPYMGELTTYSGGGDCLTGWYAHHSVKMTGSGTSGHGEALAGALSYYGCDFGVYLEP